MADIVGLTGLQIEVMRVLWNRGESTVVEVQRAMAPQRPLAQATVATLLSRLEKRGAITHRVEGRQFIYRATLAENAVRKSIVSQVTERLFAGDAPALVNQLLEERGISRADLEDMKAMIAAKEKELDKTSRPKKKGR